MIYKKEYETSERYAMSMPYGWYAAAYSHEIKTDHIIPLSILNKEFIIFRSAKGLAKVFEAYCPHQGTHLGYGGKVIDNCIVCPFHKWSFDENGKCKDIPYAKRIPALERNCLTALPTVENDGIIYIFFHPQNKKPDFFLPDFDKEFENDLWTANKRSTFFIKTHIHELGENGFDVAHFKPVHRSEENSIHVTSDTTEKTMLFQLNVVYPGAGMGLPFSKINVNTDWAMHGLGVFTNLVTLDKFPTIIRQNYCFTPQNDGRIIVRFSLRIKKSSLPGNSLAKWLQMKLINYQNVKMVLRNFKEDLPIWENKIFRPTPVLCDGDGPILHYRRWAQQFYVNDGPMDMEKLSSKRIDSAVLD